ncbi:MAG: FAD binding domain-containing protein [Azospirillaceae bacterium]|nr:FAD binding domain-containing protein [Azospirillaceae bacterium]
MHPVDFHHPTRPTPASRPPDQGVPALTGIAATADGLMVGAFATHTTIAASPLVARILPALGRLAGGVGDRRNRDHDTIGARLGNIRPGGAMDEEGDGDYPAALLALDATLHAAAPAGRRRLAAQEFLSGNAVAPDTLLAVHFPRPRRAAYARFRTPQDHQAIVGVFVADTQTGARVVVSGGAPGIFRWTAAEDALDQDFSPDALAGLALDTGAFSSDGHVIAAYRALVAAATARRAVAAC